MKRMFTAGLFILTLIVWGCAKHGDLQPGETAGPDSKGPSGTDQIVFTPFGPRKQSEVRLIKEGTHLEYKGQELMQVQNGTNKTLMNFGKQAPLSGSQSVNSVNRLKTLSSPPGPNGWVTYSGWTNSTSQPISYFATDWVVPNNPSVSSGQLLYFFNGLQNSDHILQPVLQYGQSPAGGGNYWAITSWYVGCATCPVFHGSLTAVSSGTTLHGIMQQTGQTGSNYNYTSSFTGYPSSVLPVSNIPQLYWAAESFEQYNVTNANQYPTNDFVAMKNIELKTGTSQAPLYWTAYNAITDYNQHTIIATNGSPNGEVDLYFRNPPVPPPPININNALSYDWLNGNGSGSGYINAPAGTLVHVTISAYGPGTLTNFQLNGPTLSGPMGNSVYIQNNSTTQTFTMPASGSASWSGYFQRTGSSGTGHISVY
ncbi:hypothetical protein ACFQZX_13585 [Mucilaginibacter litoreus]|uniref:Uncharacterized protein n=1 Tax=Mucilaginibacter litoreus TaxID=1048221 RepID=A0ABW3AV66_9SPHI